VIYFDAFTPGFAQGGGDAFLVFTRRSDGVDSQRNPIVDDFILFGRVRIRWAVENQVYAEIFGGAFGPSFTRDEYTRCLYFWASTRS
jgi:hypothetical protein